jgi:hypothetical protein
MFREDSIVHTSGCEEIQTPVTEDPPYCSECCKKLLWKVNVHHEEIFHRDLYDLVECSNRCILCKYICNLFGQSHIEKHLVRVTENPSKPEEHIGTNATNATNRIVYHSGGYTDLLALLRAPTISPKVSIECDWRAIKEAPVVLVGCDTTDSCLDSNGHLDHILIRISVQSLLTGVRHDSRSFTVHTEFGMYSDSCYSFKATETPLICSRQSLS